MSAPTIATCAVLGAVVGWLTPVTAYRLSVEYGSPPRSTCGDCAGPLPIAGRCPGCRAVLGPTAWLTVPVGALAFALIASALGPAPELPAYLGVAGVGVLLAFIDLACLRLPDPLVGAATILGVAPLLLVAALDGTAGPLGRAALAALLMAGIYLVLALVPGAGLGLGDVKLSGVLGFTLGWLGWPAVLLGLVLPHLLNGPIALVLLLSGRAGRRTDLPLGPALLAGWLLAVVVTA
ncbi:A24 family peptidase [Phytohabitans rumicis]|uniref:A24 family peptidase n=1 Tax=Phytohabitans rumicis TaxID=1076125 RepID=UPI0031E63C83